MATEAPPDRGEVELLARRAGLAKALAEFPQDVADAAQMAANFAQLLQRATTEAVEPWPPMRTPADG